MSFKFRRDGAIFLTEVKDGTLYIHVGSNVVGIPFKFLKEDYPLDSTEYPMCNVMCYLDNGNTKTVMRFDGTVTKYNSDGIVIGFSKFNLDDIYQYTSHWAIGSLAHYKEEDRISHYTACTIYSVNNATVREFILECIGDPVPLIVNPEKNVKFCEEIMKGTKHFPILKNLGPHLYADNEGMYTVHATYYELSKSIMI